MRITRGFFYLIIIVLPFILTAFIPFGSSFSVGGSVCGEPIGSPFIFTAIQNCSPGHLCPACIEPVHFAPLLLDLIIWYSLITALIFYRKRNA